MQVGRDERFVDDTLNIHGRIRSDMFFPAGHHGDELHNLRVLTVELDNFAQDLVSKMETEYLEEK